MPILKVACADAGPTPAVTERTVSAVAHSHFIRFDILFLPLYSMQLASDPPLLVVGVHFVDQMRELPLQQRALDLARGRHRLAFDLRIKLAIENAERFHLL